MSSTPGQKPLNTIGARLEIGRENDLYVVRLVTHDKDGSAVVSTVRVRTIEELEYLVNAASAVGTPAPR